MIKSKILLHKTVAMGLSAIVVFNSGCTAGNLGEVYHPAAMTELKFSAAPQGTNVLVEYEESSATSTKSHPRAYWLWPTETNQPVVQLRPRGDKLRSADRSIRIKPIFVDSAAETNLLAVPLINETNQVTTNGYCALVSSNQMNFKLWRNGVLLDDYKLPVYTNWPPPTPAKQRAVFVTVVYTCGMVIFVAGVLAITGL
jgi:hypothetical protein